MSQLSNHIVAEPVRTKRIGDWCTFGREYQANMNPPSEALV